MLRCILCHFGVLEFMKAWIFLHEQQRSETLKPVMLDTVDPAP